MRTIEEKNRMIAEFMGFKPENEVVNFAQPDGYTRAKSVIAYQIEPKRTDGFTNLTHDFMLKYHKSWDWLMPVVEKIDKLMLDQPIDSPFEINAEEVFTSLREVNIKLTFNRIVEFIEWYNKQN